MRSWHCWACPTCWTPERSSNGFNFNCTMNWPPAHHHQTPPPCSKSGPRPPRRTTRPTADRCRPQGNIMKKEMLINVLQPEECRIAIIENGVLEELYVERTSQESYTGNIYKGKIVNLEPSIQAAFVDFSVGRNGFLHVSDVEPQYYRRHLSE